MRKWQKIGLIIIVAVGILVSVKSCMDRKNPDLTMAYIGHGFVNYDAFDNVDFEGIIDDVNDDGAVEVSLMEISFNEELGQADKQNSQNKLANALGMGNARIYFIEEEYVINNASSGVFCDLSKLGDGFKNSDGEVVAISVRGNEKLNEMGIDTENDLYLAVRIISEMDTLSDKNIERKHNAALDMADYIIN